MGQSGIEHRDISMDMSGSEWHRAQGYKYG